MGASHTHTRARAHTSTHTRTHTDAHVVRAAAEGWMVTALSTHPGRGSAHFHAGHTAPPILLHWGGKSHLCLGCEEQRMGTECASASEVEEPGCYLRWDLIGQFAWKQRDRKGERQEGGGGSGWLSGPALWAKEPRLGVARPASGPARCRQDRRIDSWSRGGVTSPSQH